MDGKLDLAVTLAGAGGGAPTTQTFYGRRRGRFLDDGALTICRVAPPARRC